MYPGEARSGPAGARGSRTPEPGSCPHAQEGQRQEQSLGVAAPVAKSAACQAQLGRAPVEGPRLVSLMFIFPVNTSGTPKGLAQGQEAPRDTSSAELQADGQLLCGGPSAWASRPVWWSVPRSALVLRSLTWTPGQHHCQHLGLRRGRRYCQHQGQGQALLHVSVVVSNQGRCGQCPWGGQHHGEQSAWAGGACAAPVLVTLRKLCIKDLI